MLPAKIQVKFLVNLFWLSAQGGHRGVWWTRWDSQIPRDPRRYKKNMETPQLHGKAPGDPMIDSATFLLSEDGANHRTTASPWRQNYKLSPSKKLNWLLRR